MGGTANGQEGGFLMEFLGLSRCRCGHWVPALMGVHACYGPSVVKGVPGPLICAFHQFAPFSTPQEIDLIGRLRDVSEEDKHVA
jgi:hypothetical protein